MATEEPGLLVPMAVDCAPIAEMHLRIASILSLPTRSSILPAPGLRPRALCADSERGYFPGHKGVFGVLRAGAQLATSSRAPRPRQ
jgi:hypothetical protein